MRYELEMPEFYNTAGKPDFLDLTTKRTGYERFQTQNMRELVDKLEEQEEILKEALSPFCNAIFQRFHEQQQKWKQALSVIEELDCL